MRDIAEFEQYFPSAGDTIEEDRYRFRIILEQESDTFVINLKIKQRDTKEELIKFRIGIGKDKKNDSISHESHLPHFEIELYKREEESFSANIYFTFGEIPDEEFEDYAEGTVVIISRIIEKFFETHELDTKIANKIVHSSIVYEELGNSEPKLIDALYECYKQSSLTVRQKGQVFTVKTPRNLKKYLDFEDLNPIYLPLSEKIGS